MTEPSPDLAARVFTAAPAVGRHAVVIASAWVATLLLSKLPLVIARDLLGGDLPWMAAGWVGASAVFLGASFAWRALRPLQRYFAVIGLIVLLGSVVDPLIRSTPAWAALIAGRPQMHLILLDRVLLILQTVVVLGGVLLMGTPRRQAFLAVGDLGAPLGGSAARGAGSISAPATPRDAIGPSRTASPSTSRDLQPPPTRRRRLSWAVLAPVTALVLGVLFYLALASMNPALRSGWAPALPWLPLILLSAALNALGEEGTFRAAPLSTLLPAVGPRHAIGLTAVWFGLGHYYGGFPPGVAGAIGSGLLAVLMGKAMVDTRGLGWPWFIHATIDSVIYIFLATTAG